MIKFGWPLPKRLELIARLRNEPRLITEQVRFQGELQHLPIRTVPLDMPKYRIDNGRTEAAQLEYIAVNGLAPDFFSKDHESEEAQKAQHSILEGMISESNLDEYFETAKQDYPLILTENGFVLNGNRRLCTFRELYDEGPEKYASFSNIQVVILPAADERDLERLESLLQRGDDIKAKYSWVADAVKYRKRLKDFKIDEVEAMEGVDAKVILRLVDMLEYAESYLRMRGIPSQYRLITAGRSGDGKFAFEKLVDSRQKIKPLQQQAILARIAYAMMEDPEGRLYESIPSLVAYFDEAKAEIVAEIPGATELTELDEEAQRLVVNADPEAANLLKIVAKKENAEAIRVLVNDVITRRKLLERAAKSRNKVFDQIRQANTSLQTAKLAIDEDTPKDGVLEQLNAAQKLIDDLKKWATT